MFCPSSMVFIIDGHPIFWVVDAGAWCSRYPPQLKYWKPIHYDNIEDGQNKKSHLLFSLLVTIVLFFLFFFLFYRLDLLSKISLHLFIGFIWIITPLMKIYVSIQETKIIAWRSSRAKIPFVYRCVTRYAVFTHIYGGTNEISCWHINPRPMTKNDFLQDKHRSQWSYASIHVCHY